MPEEHKGDVGGARAPEAGTHHPPPPDALLHRIVSAGNLREAWRHLERRASAPGIDHVTVVEFGRDVDRHLEALARELLEETYRPVPILRLRLRHDPDRPLAIPTIRDRLVQRAIAQVIAPMLEPLMSPAAWAYRRGRSVAAALSEVDRLLELGFRFFVRTDISKFFDRIPQEPLMAELEGAVRGPRVVRLIARFVSARVLEGAAYHLMLEGVAQGSGLSPLLANLYLRPFDEEVTGAGYPLLRYADDILVLTETREESAEVLDLMSRVAAGLGLELSARKTVRGHVADGFDFLGAHFAAGGRGPSRGAIEAATARADLIVNNHTPDEGRAQLLALAERWSDNYGALRLDHVRSLPMALALLIGPAGRGQIVRRQVLQRRSTALASRAPSWVHVELAAAWLSIGEGAAFLEEAREAARQGLTPELSTRLLALAEVPAEHGPAVLDALAPSASPEAISEALARAGCLHLATQSKARLDPPPQPVGLGAGPRARELAAAMATRFVGRDDAHLVYVKDARGHRRFVRREEGADEPAFLAHLDGARPLALYLALGGGGVRMAAITVTRDKSAHQPIDALAAVSAQLLDAATAIARAAQGLGLPALSEETGGEERRVWFLFSEPVSMRSARALLVRTCTEAGALHPSIRLQRSPENDAVREGPGPMVPLPLGLHPRTGSRSKLSLPDGVGREDPLEALLAAPTITRAQVQRLVARGPLAADKGRAKGQAIEQLLRTTPRALRLVLGCNVVRGLVEKARDLGHLDGLERSTLKELLGHLGDEGWRAMTLILELTGGERKRRGGPLDPTTLPEYPVSCAKVLKRHPRQAARHPCDCKFQGLPARTYSTPVLHVLAPREVPVFAALSVPKRRKGKAGPGGQPRPPGASRGAAVRSRTEKPPVTTPSVSRILSELEELNRERRKLEGRRSALHAQLERCFEVARSERIPVEGGALVRELTSEGPRYRLELDLSGGAAGAASPGSFVPEPRSR